MTRLTLHGRWLLIAATACAACGDEPPGANQPFFWQPIDLQDAVDLGHVPRRLEPAEQTAAGLVQLSEIGEEVGLAAVVSGGNQHGVGVGFVDLNGDDFDDLVVISGRRENSDLRYASSLHMNQGDGTFVDASTTSGIADLLAGKDGYSVAAADYDADGDIDLYVTSHPRDLLLQNQGDGRFVDATSNASAGGPGSSEDAASSGSSKIAAWGDVDGDGWLDVAVASSTFDDQPQNGYLLRNLGDGTFADVTAATGFAASPSGNPCAVMWSDFDNDGDQDLWIWNDRGDDRKNRVLLRNTGGHFENFTEVAEITNDVGNPMGIDSADIDHDGHLDYYVSNIGGNPLYRSVGNSTFAEIGEDAGVRGDFGWGLGFEDLDIDGWPDIFVAQEDDFPHLTFTHQGTTDPLRFSGQMWPHAPVDAGHAHNVAVAFADYNRDGAVDVVTATTDGSRIQLYRNDTFVGSNRWLEVRVPQSPSRGDRGGITARIGVRTGDVIQFRDIHGGSSRASQTAVSARFGLGPWTGAEWVVALWPDGRQLAAINVEGNRILSLAEP